MNDLKPIAMIPDDEMQCIVDGHTAIVIPVGEQLPDEICTLLYVIPDTHRVVSVELLDWIADSCFGTDAETAIRAIINPDRSGG